MNRIARNVAWIAVLLLLMWVLRSTGPLNGFGRQPHKYNYTQLLKAIDKGEIQTARIDKNRVQGKCPGITPGEYASDLPDDQWSRKDLYAAMTKKGVEVEFLQPFLSDTAQGFILSFAVPVVFIAVFWILFWRQAQSTGNQALSFGRSRAKRLTDRKSVV